ncbi:MAG: YcaO-like family protein [Eubacteriales bacterium]
MTTNLKNNKYKEKKPMETILMIREILAKLKIIPIENSWFHLSDIFMVDLMIPNSGIHAYGKSCDYYNALANAYVELMKYLQNFFYFKGNSDFQSNHSKPFIWAPDEENITKEAYYDSENQWRDCLSNSHIQQSTLEDALPKKFICLPFVNIHYNAISNIPVNMLTHTGMCAGNTKEEALVNGLCDIMEQYVYHMIYWEQIVPPDIPKNYVQKFVSIKKLIHAIKRERNLQIVLKDFSLGKGYPTVGAMILDSECHQCTISLGCHPIFEVAAEKAIVSLISKVTFCKSLRQICKKHIESQIQYQKHLLVNQPDYTFKPFPLEEACSNKRLFNYLTNLLKLKGYHLFIRDVSFLGFPSFHITVPELSAKNIKESNPYALYMLYKQLLSHGDFHQLMDILSLDMTPLFIGMDSIYEVQIKTIPWYIENIGICIILELIEKKCFWGACMLLQRMIPSLETHPKKTYYVCLMDVIQLKEQNFNDTYIIKALNHLYQPKMVNEVISLCDNINNVLLNCYHCKNCHYRRNCTYQQTRNIYYKLIDIYSKNPIGQLSLTYKK